MKCILIKKLYVSINLFIYVDTNLPSKKSYFRPG